MPSIIVRIEWDVPNEPFWLNADNVALALSTYCTNTAFDVMDANDTQPCGHPIQAIRSSTDDLGPGGDVTNWCGWCADVAQFEREHELCQTLTAELLEYRGQVARLREALRFYNKPHPNPETAANYYAADGGHRARRALSTTDDWLTKHDTKVQAQRDRTWILTIIRAVKNCACFSRGCEALGIGPATLHRVTAIRNQEADDGPED